MKAKKWFIALLSLVMVLIMAIGFAACGPTDEDDNKGNNGGENPSGGGLEEGTLSDWYIVGMGSGTLQDCSWTSFVSDFRLTATSENTYEIKNLTLYAGAQFKFMKRQEGDGDAIITQPESESFWTTHATAGYEDLADKSGAFDMSGLGNIRLATGYDGVYNLKLIDNRSIYTVEYELVEALSPLEVTEQMYIVGQLANYPSCGWPDMVGKANVVDRCIAMTYNTTTKVWSVELDLTSSDAFKVYNVIDGSYHPDGVNNDLGGIGYEGRWLVTWTPGVDMPELSKITG